MDPTFEKQSRNHPKVLLAFDEKSGKAVKRNHVSRKERGTPINATAQGKILRLRAIPTNKSQPPEDLQMAVDNKAGHPSNLLLAEDIPILSTPSTTHSSTQQLSTKSKILELFLNKFIRLGQGEVAVHQYDKQRIPSLIQHLVMLGGIPRRHRLPPGDVPDRGVPLHRAEQRTASLPDLLLPHNHRHPLRILHHEPPLHLLLLPKSPLPPAITQRLTLRLP